MHPRPHAVAAEISLGQSLAERVNSRPWGEVRAWLEAEHPGLLERVSRLRNLDDEYRIDRVHDVVPADIYARMGITGRPQTVFRGLPASFDIRPGDWVALNPTYARAHARDTHHGEATVKRLDAVHPEDLAWAGSDEHEFFYLPAAWRPREEDQSLEGYVRSLSPAQLRILGDGEMNRITRHADRIAEIRELAVGFARERELLHGFHGPDHWARVARNAVAVARSIGVDPIVPYVFSLVHDCQREDDGLDPDHGRRAAALIRKRPALFDFLAPAEVDALARACELHSDGYTEGPGSPEVQSCWDADRLDLARVGIFPDAAYLSTAYAQRDDVIAFASRQAGRLWAEDWAGEGQARMVVAPAG